MKRQPTPVTRNCFQFRCQRPDENAVRVDVIHPETGELVRFDLRFCPAHTPDVWGLIGVRQSVIETLTA